MLMKHKFFSMDFDIVKEYYDDKIINRAKNVLLYQKHKYQYMFYNIL